jgi:DNA-binding PadR family transcriptional regulator
MISLSPLEGALLGLVGQAPRSGYDLRKAFAETPIRTFSSSPGAVYPALARLEARGLVQPADSARPSPRRRRALRLTRRGRAALLAWLLRPVRCSDLVTGAAPPVLRFAFLGEAKGPAACVPFLRSYREALRAHVAELRRFRRAAAPSMSFSGLLALDSGIAGFGAEERWVARALRACAREVKRGRP